jgi:DNA-binding GntR family transcriptional regulator
MAQASIEPNTLSQQVHRNLLGEIVAGRRPSGTVLRETDLAAELNVSRTPIREALRRLAADGLVEIHANKSAIVRSLSAEQITNVYQVREALEGMAAQLAAGRLSPDELARLDRLAQGVEAAGEERGESYREACHRLDVELHRLIAARSANPVLAREIERFHDLVQLMRDRIGGEEGALALAHRQHLAILAALAAGDGGLARARMVEHIRASSEVAVRCCAPASA